MKSTKWDNYKVGDIVVSLIDKGSCRDVGDMFKIISLSEVMYYKEHTNSSEPFTWRPATEREIELFNSGATNVHQSFIKTTPQYEIY